MSAHQILINLLGTKCINCGGIENLEIHHKDHDHNNNELNNLELFCKSCHRREHTRERIELKGGIDNKYILRADIDGENAEEFTYVKTYYGLKNDSEVVRLTIHRIYEGLNKNSPDSKINQKI